MHTLNENVWELGRTTSLDGNTSFMIVVCKMALFSSIETLSEKNVKSFEEAIYKIILRYGLSQLLITGTD